MLLTRLGQETMIDVVAAVADTEVEAVGEEKVAAAAVEIAAAVAVEEEAGNLICLMTKPFIFLKGFSF